MSREAQYRKFSDLYSGSIRRDEMLSNHTTLRIGGKADLFIDAKSSDQLSSAIVLAGELSVPYFVIGGGSNLLVSDNGYRGLIIRNLIRRQEVKENKVIAGAGESLDEIVDLATASSLSGFEFAAGIWGTVGGAVFGNAGAFGSQIGDILLRAELVDAKGKVRIESNEYFQFSYRDSNLKRTKEVVTWVEFGLKKGVGSEIESRTSEIRNLRGQRHPMEAGSAGCFFKNIEDAAQPQGKLSAGKLLDNIGAKSLTVGSAAVFAKHANILINNGSASSKDIRKLADILKDKVRDKYDIELEEEIISLGDF